MRDRSQILRRSLLWPLNPISVAKQDLCRLIANYLCIAQKQVALLSIANKPIHGSHNNPFAGSKIRESKIALGVTFGNSECIRVQLTRTTIRQDGKVTFRYDGKETTGKRCIRCEIHYITCASYNTATGLPEKALPGDCATPPNIERSDFGHAKVA